MKMRRTVIMSWLIIAAITASAILAGAAEPVKVAVLDSGSNTAYAEGISLIDGTVKDHNGHGTLMAGIIKEVSPNIEFYIIKVMGKNGLAVSEEAVTMGLEWAVSRDVDVISMSLRLKGSPGFHQAIRAAYGKGIVIVASAGNKASKMGALITNNQQQTTNYKIAYPAKYKEVIAVGALDRYGRIYDGSIRGKEVDVYCRGYKGRKAGTSIASAYAAGYIARIISENPDLRIFQSGNRVERVRELLSEEVD